MHEELLKNFHIEGTPDKVVLILSPCRSGSTALLNALCMVDGNDGVYQPIKSVVRRLLAGDNEPLTIQAKDGNTLIIKETLGYETFEEVNYDPIGTLIEKGVDPKNLYVVPMLREPEACFQSWTHNYLKHGADLSVLAHAYHTVYDDCEAYARRLGVNIVPLHFEDLEGSAGREALHAFTQKLRIPFHESMLDWTQSDKPRFENGFVFKEYRQPLERHGTTGDVPNRKGLDVVVRRPSGLILPPEFSDLQRLVVVARTVYDTIKDLGNTGATSDLMRQMDAAILANG